MNKKKISIIVASVVLCAIIGVTGFSVVKKYFITKNPADHLLYSAMQMSKLRNFSATATVNMYIDEKTVLKNKDFSGAIEDNKAMIKYANTLLKKLDISYLMNIISDTDDLPQMDMDMSVNYSKKPLLNFKMDFKPWQFGFAVPQLYKKAFYLDINKAFEKASNEEAANMSFKDIDYKAYWAMLTKEDDMMKALMKNDKPYRDVLYQYLESKAKKIDDNKITLYVNGKSNEIGVTKYKLSVSITEMLDLYQKFIEIVKNDKAAKNLVLSRVRGFKELALKNKDYEKNDQSREEFSADMKDLENTIDKDWKKSLDELLTQLKTALTGSEAVALKNIKYDYTIAIDHDDMMRQIELDSQIEFIKLHEVITYNEFGKDVKVSTTEKNNAVDIMSLEQNQQTGQEIIKDMGNNAVTKILGGEAVKTLIADLKTEAKILPEDQRKQLIDVIDTYVNQAKVSVPYVLEGLGTEQ